MWCMLSGDTAEHSCHWPGYLVCLTLASLVRVMYFICDTILFVGSTGLASGVNKEKWRRWAARYYYYSLLLSLVRDLYEVSLQIKQVAHDRARGRSQRPRIPSQVQCGWRGDRVAPVPSSSLIPLSEGILPCFWTQWRTSVTSWTLDQLRIYKSNPGIIGLEASCPLAGIITVAYPQMKLKTHWHGFRLRQVSALKTSCEWNGHCTRHSRVILCEDLFHMNI